MSEDGSTCVYLGRGNVAVPTFSSFWGVEFFALGSFSERKEYKRKTKCIVWVFGLPGCSLLSFSAGAVTRFKRYNWEVYITFSFINEAEIAGQKTSCGSYIAASGQEI